MSIATVPGQVNDNLEEVERDMEQWRITHERAVAALLKLADRVGRDAYLAAVHEAARNLFERDMEQHRRVSHQLVSAVRDYLMQDVNISPAFLAGAGVR